MQLDCPFLVERYGWGRVIDDRLEPSGPWTNQLVTHLLSLLSQDEPQPHLRASSLVKSLSNSHWPRVEVFFGGEANQQASGPPTAPGFAALNSAAVVFCCICVPSLI